jgi:hypothetical protein
MYRKIWYKTLAKKMSLAYESYHLRAPDIGEVVSLLKKSGLKGFIFPACDGWVSFCPQGLPFAQNESLIANNIGLLLQVACSEDYGWTFVLFDREEIVFVYDSPGPDYAGTSAMEVEDARLMDHFCWLSSDEKENLSAIMFDRPFEGESISNAYDFCRILNLPAFRDISFEVLEASKRNASTNPLVIEVE